MVDRPAPIAMPTRCEVCGQVPPLPADPEVARWSATAQDLVRRSRQAVADGVPQIALTLRKRAASALLSAIEAQTDVELRAGRS